MHVRARQGFFGPSDPNEPKGFGYDTLTTAALSPFASGGITVRLTSMFGHDTKQGAYVRSLLFIDTSDLQFDEDQPGRHTATFQVNLLAVGDNGEVLAEWRRLVPVALDDQQFQVAKERGIVYSVRTQVKEPGGYQMRAAVRDANTKLTGFGLAVPRGAEGRLGPPRALGRAAEGARRGGGRRRPTARPRRGARGARRGGAPRAAGPGARARHRRRLRVRDLRRPEAGGRGAASRWPRPCCAKARSSTRARSRR